MKTSSRRDFFKKATLGVVTATVMPAVVEAEVISAPEILSESVKGANDRIRIAVLGVNGRGQTHVDEIMKISKEIMWNWLLYVIQIWIFCKRGRKRLKANMEKISV